MYSEGSAESLAAVKTLYGAQLAGKAPMGVALVADRPMGAVQVADQGGEGAAAGWGALWVQACTASGDGVEPLAEHILGQLRSRYTVPEPPEIVLGEGIPAFARVQFPSRAYLVQRQTVTLGRALDWRQLRQAAALGKRKFLPEIVDIPVSASRQISKFHAALSFNSSERVWEVKPMGQGGIGIDGIAYPPFSEAIPLIKPVSRIQIADVVFFVLQPVEIELRSGIELPTAADMMARRIRFPTLGSLKSAEAATLSKPDRDPPPREGLRRSRRQLARQRRAEGKTDSVEESEDSPWDNSDLDADIEVPRAVIPPAQLEAETPPPPTLPTTSQSPQPMSMFMPGMGGMMGGIAAGMAPGMVMPRRMPGGMGGGMPGMMAAGMVGPGMMGPVMGTGGGGMAGFDPNYGMYGFPGPGHVQGHGDFPHMAGPGFGKPFPGHPGTQQNLVEYPGEAFDRQPAPPPQATSRPVAGSGSGPRGSGRKRARSPASAATPPKPVKIRKPRRPRSPEGNPYERTYATTPRSDRVRGRPAPGASGSGPPELKAAAQPGSRSARRKHVEAYFLPVPRVVLPAAEPPAGSKPKTKAKNKRSKPKTITLPYTPAPWVVWTWEGAPFESRVVLSVDKSKLPEPDKPPPYYNAYDFIAGALISRAPEYRGTWGQISQWVEATQPWYNDYSDPIDWKNTIKGQLTQQYIVKKAPVARRSSSRESSQQVWILHPYVIEKMQVILGVPVSVPESVLSEFPSHIRGSGVNAARDLGFGGGPAPGPAASAPLGAESAPPTGEGAPPAPPPVAPAAPSTNSFPPDLAQ